MFIKLDNCVEYNDATKLDEEEFKANEYYVDSKDIWKFKLSKEEFNTYQDYNKAKINCEVLTIYHRTEPDEYSKFLFLEKERRDEIVEQIILSGLEQRVVETFG
jgi:hypothetical protein